MAKSAHRALAAVAVAVAGTHIKPILRLAAQPHTKSELRETALRRPQAVIRGLMEPHSRGRLSEPKAVEKADTRRLLGRVV